MPQNKIVYGTRTFTHDDIKSGNCYTACSLLSSELEINSFECEIISNDTSLTSFEVDAPLVYYVDEKRVGTYYIQNIVRIGKNLYQFDAVSAIGLLDKRDHYGGIYTGQTVADVVADICGGVSVTVASNIAHIKLYGWLPIASRRANLAQVLFAISAAVTEDAAGALQIGGLERQVSGSFPEDAVFLGGTVEYGSPAVQVVVTEHQYIKSEEEQKLFEGTTLNGDRITFSEPMHSLSASGFTILSSGENYAVVSSGSGTLTGKKYTHATREVIGQRETAQEAQSDASENTVRVTDATLVSMANSRAVADRLAEYYAHAERVREDVILTGQKAGDVVRMTHPYDLNLVTACVESLDINLSGLARAAATALVGYIPPDITQIEYYDTFELLTGSGTWTPPTGIKNLRAVLIGAGSGGQSATAGESGARGTRSGAKGGAGGLGGAAGAGGKIFQTEVTTTAGQQFAYRCGAAGVGGAYDALVQADGTAGEDTTFGVFSSASGAVSDIGYINLFNDTVYAIPGDAGLDGGKGGDAQFHQDNSRSESGGDVPPNTGGLGGKSYYNGPNQTGYDQNNIGGGGGGAAAGQNGADAADAKGHNGSVGADGASASAHTRAIPLGGGGHGGNGGGGGGAGGVLYYLATSTEPAETRTYAGGVGGAGTAGSNGGAGCVLLFYSLPRKEE